MTGRNQQLKIQNELLQDQTQQTFHEVNTENSFMLENSMSVQAYLNQVTLQKSVTKVSPRSSTMVEDGSIVGDQSKFSGLNQNYELHQNSDQTKTKYQSNMFLQEPLKQGPCTEIKSGTNISHQRPSQQTTRSQTQVDIIQRDHLINPFQSTAQNLNTKFLSALPLQPQKTTTKKAKFIQTSKTPQKLAQPTSSLKYTSQITQNHSFHCLQQENSQQDINDISQQQYRANYHEHQLQPIEKDSNDRKVMQRATMKSPDFEGCTFIFDQYGRVVKMYPQNQQTLNGCGSLIKQSVTNQTSPRRIQQYSSQAQYLIQKSSNKKSVKKRRVKTVFSGNVSVFGDISSLRGGDVNQTKHKVSPRKKGLAGIQDKRCWINSQGKSSRNSSECKTLIVNFIARADSSDNNLRTRTFRSKFLNQSVGVGNMPKGLAYPQLPISSQNQSRTSHYYDDNPLSQNRTPTASTGGVLNHNRYVKNYFKITNSKFVF